MQRLIAQARRSQKRLGLFKLFCAILLSTGIACRQDPVSSAEKTIVTSFYPVYIATLNVVGDLPGVRVVNLASPQTGCLHHYQLNPQDLALLSNASVFVVNGAGMESFLGRVTSQMKTLSVVDATGDFPTIAHGSEPNPHVWVSLLGAMAQVKNIAEGLARVDPIRAKDYRANAATYLLQLDSLQQRMHESLTNLTQHRIVTFHEAFAYFAVEFGLDVVAVIEREPGSEPSAAALKEIIQTVKDSEGVPLFAEPQYSSKSAEVIARETGSTVYLLDPAVSGPMSKRAYIDIMDSNLVVLLQALK